MKKQRVWIKILSALALLGLFWSIESSGYILVNRSASIPKGVYIRMNVENITYGSYITYTIAKETFFEPKTALWYPEDSTFMKPVVGFSGDPITVYKNGYKVGDTLLFPRYPHDREGTALPSLLEGFDVVPKGSVVVGSPLPESFDSRYIGPMPLSMVHRAYRLVLEW